MIVEGVIPTAACGTADEQRPYPVYRAARLLEFTETALGAQIFCGRINGVKVGKKTFISRDELGRMSGLSA